MNGRKGWMDGWTDGWMDGWMDKWMNDQYCILNDFVGDIFSSKSGRVYFRGTLRIILWKRYSKGIAISRVLPMPRQNNNNEGIVCSIVLPPTSCYLRHPCLSIESRSSSSSRSSSLLAFLASCFSDLWLLILRLSFDSWRSLFDSLLSGFLFVFCATLRIPPREDIPNLTCRTLL